MAKRYYDGGYAGMDSRKAQEREDGSMIKEDHSAMANLPQNVIMKPWPTAGTYLPENLDDTISGINRQVGLDSSKKDANLEPKKV
jgi:hypothetical protein